MDGLFDLLKASGNNSIDKIISLFKEAKILEIDMEGKFRELFQDAPNPEDISMEQFTDAVTRFADEHQRTVEELADMLTVAGTELLKLTEDVEDAIVQVVASMTEGEQRPPS